ncbi:putative head morphogenesis protein [Vibrio phage vB_VhaS_R21Y]|nr:putative head morphogenesis protein [Vibrio phage vB_VhaS_R21Y]
MPTLEELEAILFALGERLARVYLSSIDDFLDEVEVFLDRNDLEGARAHIRDLTLEPLYEANREVIERANMQAFIFGSQMIQQNPVGVPSGIVPSIVSAASEQTGLMLRDLSVTIQNRMLRRVNQFDTDLINRGLKQETPTQERQRILNQFKDNLRRTARGGGSSLVDLVSSLNTTRLVSYGFMNEAALVGIRAYRYNALIDVRTTDFCRHLDGRVFEITNQLDRLDRELRINDSDEIRNFAPFPRFDQIDEFRAMTNEQLTARGWSYPPLHFYCRSVIEYIQGEIQVAGLEIPTAREGLQEILTSDEIRALLNLRGITNTTINLTQGALAAGASALSIIQSLGISAETLGLINAAIQAGLLE